jgi:hypothetical protein
VFSATLKFRQRALAAAVICLLTAILGMPRSLPLIMIDSVRYRQMALRNFSNVPGSIAGRFLHPAVVYCLSHAAHIDVDRAFLAVALASLLVFVVGLVALAETSPVATVAVVFSPVLLIMFSLFYVQDLFYAALLTIFFLALRSQRDWLAVAMLPLLYFTRESTLLLGLIVLVASVLASRRVLAVGSVCAAVAGLFVTRVMASYGLPNVHHLNEFIFLFAKVPADLARNVFGVIVVPNSLRGYPGYTCAPMAAFSLPAWLRLGIVREVGICAPNPRSPLLTFTLWLSFFGILPLTTASAVFAGAWRLMSRCAFWEKIAFAYGVAYFLIAPAVSVWLVRDMGYAWPAFWLVGARVSDFGRSKKLLFLHLLACWLPFVVGIIVARHRPGFGSYEFAHYIALRPVLGLAVLGALILIYLAGAVEVKACSERRAELPPMRQRA